MKSLFTFIVIFFITLSICSCKETSTSKSEDNVTINFNKDGILHLKKSTSDSIIATLDVEVADDDYKTQTGLMYRTSLGKKQGMLFIFPDEDYRSFYMKNTKFPLDIIYIATDKSIVSFQKNAQPFDETSLPSNSPAKYVLEINAGLSDEWQLKVGDKIEFEITE